MARKTAKAAGSKAKPKSATATATWALNVDDDDIYSARGGAPNASLAATGHDRSASREATRELSWSQFDGYVQQLAQEAKARFKPTAIVGLAHGGVFVGGAVASALQVEFFPLRLTRRSRDTRVSTALTDEMPSELAGRIVVVFDDVAGSGDSLDAAMRLAKAAGAKRVVSAALVARPTGFTPDLTGFVSQGLVIFPWDYSDVAGDTRFEPPAASPPSPTRRRRRATP